MRRGGGTLERDEVAEAGARLAVRVDVGVVDADRHRVAGLELHGAVTEDDVARGARAEPHGDLGVDDTFTFVASSSGIAALAGEPRTTSPVTRPGITADTQ